MAVFAAAAAWVLSSLIYSSGQPRELQRSASVDIGGQYILFMEGAREANLALVSTGRPNFATPTGDFQILYRLRNPVSSSYNVRMPYWMCITPGEAIGLHQAGRSGEARLGEPLSHGCVRLGETTARLAYSWLPIGAPVTIR